MTQKREMDSQNASEINLRNADDLLERSTFHDILSHYLHAKVNVRTEQNNGICRIRGKIFYMIAFLESKNRGTRNRGNQSPNKDTIHKTQQNILPTTREEQNDYRFPNKVAIRLSFNRNERQRARQRDRHNKQ